MPCQRRGVAKGHRLHLPCLAQRSSGILINYSSPLTGPRLVQSISEVEVALLSVVLLQTVFSLEAFHSQNGNFV